VRIVPHLTIKALTIKQPWAELVALGLKDIENRGWRSRYRGVVCIHASKTFDHACLEWIRDRFADNSRVMAVLERPENLALGAFIGAATLADITRHHPSPWAQEGMEHWVFREARKFPTAYPWRGTQSLWTVPDELAREFQRKGWL
jgi:hypothetical protein